MHKILPVSNERWAGRSKIKNAANRRKTACSGAFGVPDTTRTCDPGLRRLVLYPTELLGHISKIFNFPAQTDSNELPLRRRSLYTTELQGRMESICVASDACMASRIRGGLSALLSGHGGSAENIVPVFCPAVNGKGLPHRRQPSVAHWMTRTRITFSSAVTSPRTD